jgi:hypothetical protein
MPLSTKVIRVPVKLVDGGWELLYGGPVKVKEGAVGELHLDHMYFTDKKVSESADHQAAGYCFGGGH